MKLSHFRSKSSNRDHPRSAFTLIELLVVIAVIGVLVALLLPAVQHAREAARRSQCTNNLKQIALAIHNFEDSRQTLPSSRLGPQHATWLVQILPFLEQANLYNSWNVTKSYYLQQSSARTSPVPVFSCPTRRTAILSTQFEVSSTGIPDSLEYPGVCGDYAGNGGHFAGSIVDDPLCQGLCVRRNHRSTAARW